LTSLRLWLRRTLSVIRLLSTTRDPHRSFGEVVTQTELLIGVRHVEASRDDVTQNACGTEIDGFRQRRAHRAIQQGDCRTRAELTGSTGLCYAWSDRRPAEIILLERSACVYADTAPCSIARSLARLAGINATVMRRRTAACRVQLLSLQPCKLALSGLTEMFTAAFQYDPDSQNHAVNWWLHVSVLSEAIQRFYCYYYYYMTNAWWSRYSSMPNFVPTGSGVRAWPKAKKNICQIHQISEASPKHIPCTTFESLWIALRAGVKY